MSDQESHEQIRNRAIAERMQLLVLCQPGACPVCIQFNGLVYWADEAVELPIGGCLKHDCKCEYRVIDPNGPTLEEMLEAGIQAARSKKRDEAREWLFGILRIDRYNEQAWLWLSGVVESDEDRLECMERVLEINPDNEFAQRGLAALHDRGIGAPPPPDIQGDTA